MEKQKPKPNQESFIKPIMKKYRKMNDLDKRLILSFIGIMIIILTINLTLETIRNFNSDVSLNERNALRSSDVRYFLSLQEENKYLAFLYAFDTPLIWFMGARGLAWVIHGVGFHIIKRWNTNST